MFWQLSFFDKICVFQPVPLASLEEIAGWETDLHE